MAHAALDRRTDGPLDHAAALYEAAVYRGDPVAIAQGLHDLDSVEADAALARGRLLHARFLSTGEDDGSELALFEHAASLYERLGDLRGLGEASFWIGAYYQVVRRSPGDARPFLERGHELAVRAVDPLTRSYTCRHLGLLAAENGDLETARALLSESLERRHEIGSPAGVAAAMLALADLEQREHRLAQAWALVDAARRVADGCGAHAVSDWARAQAARLDYRRPAPGTVTDVLDAAGVAYELIEHPPTASALAEATALGVLPEDVAKTVILVGPDMVVRAVVPAGAHVRLRRTAELAGSDGPLRLASEREIAGRYPEFEVGAVPPFGGAARDVVLVDTSVAHRANVIVEAGSHDRSLRLVPRAMVDVCVATVGQIASFRPLPPPPAHH